MFKSLSRKLSTTVCYFKGNFALRDFIYDNHSGDSGTLVHKFMKYIALEKTKSTKLVKSEIKYTQYYPVHQFGNFRNVLRSTPSHEVPKLMSFTYTYKNNADGNKFVDVINEIDNDSAGRISTLDNEEILQILYGFYFVLQNRVTQTKFYHNAIERLAQQFSETANKTEFVEICFYLGLAKKNPKVKPILLQFQEANFSKYVHEMNAYDFAIVINAAYKTSTKIKLADFQQHLSSKLLNAVETQNPFHLVNLVKSARHNKINSDIILQTLESVVLSKEFFNQFDFRGLSHLFAFFADNNYKNDKMLSIIINRGMELIYNEFDFNIKHNANFRQKDLSTFVWCCGFLGLQNLLNEKHYQTFLKIIQHFCSNQQYKYDPDELIDVVLNLWMLNRKHSEFMPYIESLYYGQKYPAAREKLDSRFRLLLTLVEIEKHEANTNSKQSQCSSFTDSIAAPKYLLQNRPQLQKAKKVVQQQSNIKSSTYVCQIKNLNIAGIVVEYLDDLKLHIEVMDSTNTLSDGVTPNGIFMLKLNALKMLGCNIIVVPKLLTDESEVHAFLLEELNKNISVSRINLVGTNN